MIICNLDSKQFKRECGLYQPNYSLTLKAISVLNSKLFEKLLEERLLCLEQTLIRSPRLYLGKCTSIFNHDGLSTKSRCWISTSTTSHLRCVIQCTNSIQCTRNRQNLLRFPLAAAFFECYTRVTQRIAAWSYLLRYYGLYDSNADWVHASRRCCCQSCREHLVLSGLERRMFGSTTGKE